MMYILSYRTGTILSTVAQQVLLNNMTTKFLRSYKIHKNKDKIDISNVPIRLYMMAHVAGMEQALQ